MENIGQFVEQLLNDKGVTGMDDAVKQQLKHDLSERLIDFINKRLIEALPETEMPQFLQLLDEQPADPVKIQNFISEKLPNKDQIAIDAMAEFRVLYMGAQA